MGNRYTQKTAKKNNGPVNVKPHSGVNTPKPQVPKRTEADKYVRHGPVRDKLTSRAFEDVSNALVDAIYSALTSKTKKEYTGLKESIRDMVTGKRIVLENQLPGQVARLLILEYGGTVTFEMGVIGDENASAFSRRLEKNLEKKLKKFVRKDKGVTFRVQVRPIGGKKVRVVIEKIPPKEQYIQF